jgi:FKBP-type peptidyl-prolyl cis-trans isomerase SlyD
MLLRTFEIGYTMQISRNHVVTLKYQVADRDGEVVDAGQEHLVYLHGGYGGLFDALEVALQGKSEGEAFSVALTADEAFGEYDQELVSVEPRDVFPANIQVGTQVELDDEDGESMLFSITDINGDEVTINGNHPLCGKDLVFSGTVIAIRPATAKELARGEAN